MASNEIPRILNSRKDNFFSFSVFYNLYVFSMCERGNPLQIPTFSLNINISRNEILKVSTFPSMPTSNDIISLCKILFLITKNTQTKEIKNYAIKETTPFVRISQNTFVLGMSFTRFF